MTKLTAGKKVIRETQALDRGRPIVVELHPHHLVLRLKGERKEWTVAYDKLLWFACRRDAERAQAERALAHKREAAHRTGR
jgi:hypothetical protein